MGQMSTLSRYVSSTLIKSTLLILLVFVGLEVFFLLAAQLKSLGKGSYTFWQAFLYVLLILPQQTYFLFPMTGLLGMLFGFGLLANHSELIVMRVSGISTVQIVRFAFQAGIVLILMMTLIGEVIGPFTKALAEKRKLMQTSAGQVLKTTQGVWLRQKNTFYYINTIYSSQSIADVSRYVFHDQQLVSTGIAKKGDYKNNHWQMTDIKESIISPENVTSKTIPTAFWNLAINPDLLQISQNLPDEMSLTQLKNLIHYQKKNHLVQKNYQIAYWQRLFQPFASLVLMFLAIPFIFGPLRSVTTSLRLVLGIVVGFTFYISNQLFPPLSQVLDFPPMLAAILPIFFFAVIGVMLMRRVR
jgi:lipopolysaccharide export system permease protein